MSGCRIYVDIDDVLSRTIESLVALLEQTHDRRVEVEAVQHFDLERSFGLTAEEIHVFMERAHSDEVLEALEPEEGAAAALKGWAKDGHRVALVTGRPPMTQAASQRWLAQHEFAHDSLHHLDKWNRPSWNVGRLPALRFEDIEGMGFEFAVEDSLDTAVRLAEEFEIQVALMDRPWNRDLAGVSAKARAGMTRCAGWIDVAELFAKAR